MEKKPKDGDSWKQYEIDAVIAAMKKIGVKPYRSNLEQWKLVQQESGVTRQADYIRDKIQKLIRQGKLKESDFISSPPKSNSGTSGKDNTSPLKPEVGKNISHPSTPSLDNKAAALEDKSTNQAPPPSLENKATTLEDKSTNKAPPPSLENKAPTLEDKSTNQTPPPVIQVSSVDLHPTVHHKNL